MLKLFLFPLYVTLNRKLLFFFLYLKDVLTVANSFIIRSYTVQHNINSRRCLLCTGSENMSEHSQVEQLPETWRLIHPSHPFSPGEPGKHPAWHIWRSCPWAEPDGAAEDSVGPSPDQTGVLPRRFILPHTQQQAGAQPRLWRHHWCRGPSSRLCITQNTPWLFWSIQKRSQRRVLSLNVCSEGKSNTSNLWAVTAVCPVCCLLISISYR